MSGLKFWTFALLNVCLSSLCIHADLTDDELNTMMEINMPYIEACIKDDGMTMEDLKELHPDSETFSCFFSCFLKKLEVWNDDSTLDSQKLSEFIRLFIKEEDTLNTLDAYIVECSKVNDVEISHGNERCERAKLLFECWQQHEGVIIGFLHTTIWSKK